MPTRPPSSLGGSDSPRATNAPTLVLLGDSNGSMYAKTVREIASELSINLNVLSVAAGDPLPDTELYRDALNFLEQERPAVTLFVNRWSGKVGKRPDRLRTAVEAILQNSSRMILIEQTPTLPAYAKREVFRREGLRVIREEIEDTQLRHTTNQLLRSLQSNRVTVIKVEDLFIDSDGAIPYTDRHGQPLWHDATHLSGNGAELVRPRLRDAIKAAIGADVD